MGAVAALWLPAWLPPATADLAMLLPPAALLLYLVISCLRQLPGLVVAAVGRVKAWELLEAPVRTIDLTPLGVDRRVLLRQHYGAAEADPEAGGAAEVPEADTAAAAGGVPDGVLARPTGRVLWGGALDLVSFLLADNLDGSGASDGGHPDLRAALKLRDAARGTGTGEGSGSWGGGQLCGCPVLELGAGLGLPAIVAALCGARPVVLTDGAAGAVAAAQSSVSENLSEAEVGAAARL